MTIFAIVFPGQGSQKVGMLKTLAKKYKIIKDTFDEASTILGYDLWKCVQIGPSKELNKTCNAQPALLTASIAIWRLWKKLGGKNPTLLAGHSLGEYSALVCAKSIKFNTAIKLIQLRSKIMEEALISKKYSMYAIIGLKSNIILEVCKQSEKGQIVTPVSFNSPYQIVIAGHKEAVERTCYICNQLGAKRTIKLSVNVLSHCVLMKNASSKLAKVLEEIKIFKPKIPVINNVDVRSENNPILIRQALVRQLYNPVRWTETIEYFSKYGITKLLEIGPGKVLTNINKQIVPTISVIAINDIISIMEAIKY